jgi:sugar phosphate isomerase/epimerase
MFPVRRFGQEVSAFRPSIDPTDVGYRHYTLDLSHTAAAQVDALELAKRMGDGLRHVHLADGSGQPRDEHLVPGRGNQPCAELCEGLAGSGFPGQVVLEVNTRRARGPVVRAKDLTEALLFARLHLGQ